MRFFKYGPLGIFGFLVLAAELVTDAIRLLLEWPWLRRLLEMANWGQAVDFALEHWAHPGWLGNPWVQFLVIIVGLGLIFWDKRHPSWLPSPDLSSRQMIIGGLVIIFIGLVIAGVGLWRSEPPIQITKLTPPATLPASPAPPATVPAAPAVTQQQPVASNDISRRLMELSELEKNTKIIRTIQKDGDGLRSKSRMEKLSERGSVGNDWIEVMHLRDRANSAQTRQSQIYEKYKFADISQAINSPPGIGNSCNQFITLLNSLKFPLDLQVAVYDQPAYQVFSESIDELGTWVDDSEAKIKSIRAEYEKEPTAHRASSVAVPQDSPSDIDIAALPSDKKHEFVEALIELQPSLPTVVIMRSASPPYSQNLSEMAALFGRAGIRAETGVQYPQPRQTGLQIGVENTKQPPEMARKIKSIFEKVGIPVSYYKLGTNDGSAGSFNIFIGPKPL